jgi:hypothetical protein
MNLVFRRARAKQQAHEQGQTSETHDSIQRSEAANQSFQLHADSSLFHSGPGSYRRNSEIFDLILAVCRQRNKSYA